MLPSTPAFSCDRAYHPYQTQLLSAFVSCNGPLGGGTAMLAGEIAQEAPEALTTGDLAAVPRQARAPSSHSLAGPIRRRECDAPLCVRQGRRGIRHSSGEVALLAHASPLDTGPKPRIATNPGKVQTGVASLMNNDRRDLRRITSGLLKPSTVERTDAPAMVETRCMATEIEDRNTQQVALNPFETSHVMPSDQIKRETHFGEHPVGPVRLGCAQLRTRRGLE
jgi:hypothetical protein